jgi:hypothetical protein
MVNREQLAEPRFYPYLSDYPEKYLSGEKEKSF